MLLENPHPSSICSIEDKVIEAKEMEEGLSNISRQEIIPYRHCSLVIIHLFRVTDVKQII
jgi:hypothetical protein